VFIKATFFDYHGNVPCQKRKIRSRFIICTQRALIWCKGCKNQSSRSGDIPQNTPFFWPCHTRRSQMSSVNSGITGPNFTKFSHDTQTSFSLLMHTLRLQYFSPLGKSCLKGYMFYPPQFLSFYLARSEKFPEGLYILPTVSFFFYISSFLMISPRQIISRSTGPIFAIFTSNESI